MSEKCYRDLPRVIVCMDKKLNVVIEACSLTDYTCHKTGYFRKYYEEPEEKRRENPGSTILRGGTRLTVTK